MLLGVRNFPSLQNLETGSRSHLLAVKQPGREAARKSKVENEGRCISTPLIRVYNVSVTIDALTACNGSELWLSVNCTSLSVTGFLFYLTFFFQQADDCE